MFFRPKCWPEVKAKAGPTGYGIVTSLDQKTWEAPRHPWPKSCTILGLIKNHSNRKTARLTKSPQRVERGPCFFQALFWFAIPPPTQI